MTQPNKPDPGAQDDMRAAFETTARQVGYNLTRRHNATGNYAFPAAAGAWYGFQTGAQWQASRALLASQPIPYSDDIIDEFQAEARQAKFKDFMQAREAYQNDTVLELQRLRTVQAESFELTARLCGIRVVADKDGYELIRRDSVMDFVTRWRERFDAASALKNAQGDKQ